MLRELSLGEIFKLGYYWETKILLTAIKLDIFTSLHAQGLTCQELASRHHVDSRALGLLMNALVAMRVLMKKENQFSNSSVAQKHLVKTNPEYVGHLLILHDTEWANWGKLEETIRTGNSPVKQHVFETDPEMGANVLAVLDRIGKGSGISLAKRLALSGSGHLLDVGGGAGTNSIAFCQEYPNLRATVFDLPATLKVTRRAVEEAGLCDRIRLMPGNFLEDSFNGSYQVALMSDVLHYQGGGTNGKLVRKVHEHLVPGGSLVIKDRFLDASRSSPAWTTAFAVHIMLNTEHGDCFTTEEAMEWMRNAGFEEVVELEPRAVVQGKKPE